MSSDPAQLLFAELAAMRKKLRNHPPGRLLGDIGIGDLMAMAQALERAHAYAAEMELGASGFDNEERVKCESRRIPISLLPLRSLW